MCGLMFAVTATLPVALGPVCALCFVMKFLLLASFILDFVSMENLGCKVRSCNDCSP